jgi:hypothetical protein
MAPERRYCLDDYFAVETRSPIRHEYANGEIFATAGASVAHIPGRPDTVTNPALLVAMKYAKDAVIHAVSPLPDVRSPALRSRRRRDGAAL